MGETFKALVLDQVDDTFSAEFRDVAVDDLPEGDVTVAIEYSTINYKDGLVINGNVAGDSGRCGTRDAGKRTDGRCCTPDEPRSRF